MKEIAFNPFHPPNFSSFFHFFHGYVIVVVISLTFWAQVVVADGVVSFNFPDFSNSSSLKLNGARVEGGDLVLSTTDSGISHAAWYQDKVQVRGFETSFSFVVGDIDAHPQGFAFVMQLESPTILGPASAGLGYGDVGSVPAPKGIYPSIAVEFDMQMNSQLLDPDSNHIALHIRLDGPNNANESYNYGNVFGKILPLMANGEMHTVSLVYDPSVDLGTLQIKMDNLLYPSYTQGGINLQNLLGLDDLYGQAWIGFTSSETNLIIDRWLYRFTGVIDPENFIIEGLNLDTDPLPYAGQNASFYVQAVDQYGNNITTNTATFSVELKDAAGRSLVLPAVYLGVGKYGFYYNVTTTGSISFSIAVNGTILPSSPFRFKVVPGPADPAQSLAWGDGIDTKTVAAHSNSFQIQLYDAFGNNVTTPLATPPAVKLFLDGKEHNSLISVSYVDSGLYLAQYNIITAGKYDVEITIDDVPIQNSNHFLEIVPGPLIESNSIAYGDGLLGTTVAGELREVYVQLRDLYGNNITQPEGNNIASLEIVDINFNVFVRGVVSYVGSGVYYIVYNATVSGQFLVQTMVNLIDVVNGAKALEVLPMPFVSPKQSLVYGSGTVTGEAGSLSEFSVQLRDPFGNNITSSPPGTTVSAFLRPFSGDNDIIDCDVDYYGNGIYDLDYNVTVATYYNLTVSVNDNAVTQTLPQVQIFPASVYAATSQAVGEGLDVDGIAGQSHSFLINLRDVFGNSITTRQPTVKIAATLTNFDDDVKPDIEADISFDAGNFAYRATYNITISGKYSLFIAINEKPIKNAEHVVLVSPAALVPATSVAFGELEVNGVAGQTHNFSIQVKDIFGNNVTDIPDPKAVSIGVRILGNGFVNASVVYTSLGVFNASYNITRSGGYLLQIAIFGQPISNSQHNITVSPSAVFAPLCFAEGQGLNSSTAGKNGLIWVHLFDVFANKVWATVGTPAPLVVAQDTNNNNYYATVHPDDPTGNFIATYNLTKSGTFLLHITVNGAYIRNPTYNLQVSPAKLDVHKSVAYGGYLFAGVAGDEPSFWLQLRDTFANNITNFQEVNEIRATMVMGTYTADVHIFPEPSQQGQYIISYTTTKSGIYATNIQINGADITGSPFSTNINHAQFDPKHTRPVNPPPSTLAGQNTKFYLQFYDSYDNRITEATVPVDQMVVSISPILDSTFPDYSANLSYNSMAALVTYNVTTSGKYNLSVNLTGYGVLGGLPVTIAIQPNVTSASHSVFGDEAHNYRKANVKSTITVPLYTFDAFGNKRLKGGDDIQVLLTSPGVDDTHGSAKDYNNGKYDISYFLHDKAMYEMDIAINGVSMKGAPFSIDAQYKNNPTPTLIIIGSVFGGCILLALLGFFIYKRYNRWHAYEVLE